MRCLGNKRRGVIPMAVAWELKLHGNGEQSRSSGCRHALVIKLIFLRCNVWQNWRYWMNGRGQSSRKGAHVPCVHKLCICIWRQLYFPVKFYSRNTKRQQQDIIEVTDWRTVLYGSVSTLRLHFADTDTNCYLAVGAVYKSIFGDTIHLGSLLTGHFNSAVFKTPRFSDELLWVMGDGGGSIFHSLIFF